MFSSVDSCSLEQLGHKTIGSWHKCSHKSYLHINLLTQKIPYMEIYIEKNLYFIIHWQLFLTF